MQKSIHQIGLKRLSTWVLGIAVLFLLVGLWGFWRGVQLGDARPLISWLLGLAFWLAVGIGMLLLIMLWYVFGSGWSVILRRQLEHAMTAFPLLALTFIPFLLLLWWHDSPGLLWKWADPQALLPGGEHVAQDALYQGKAVYLNPLFFTVRAVLFFGLWSFLGLAFRYCSYRMDSDPRRQWADWPTYLSAAGIPLTALTLTFAAIDWFKSLEFHWFSTMYGVWFFSSGIRIALAAIIVLCAFLHKQGYLKGYYNQAHRYNLACLALAFTVFWGYISFSQFFLIYHANIPEETFWYHMRIFNPIDYTHNSWYYVGVFGLIAGHFFVPFLYLLSYKNKVVEKRLLFISVWILIFQMIDFHYNIVPGRLPSDNAVGYDVREFSITVFDFASWIGMGALCLWAYLRSAAKHGPIPVSDPQIQKALHYYE